MNYVLSNEAQRRMVERGISEGMVRAAVKAHDNGTTVVRSDGEGGVRINMPNMKGMYCIAFAPGQRVVKTVTWVVGGKDGRV